MVWLLTIGVPALSNVAMKGSTVVLSLFALELGAGAATIGVLVGLYAVFPALLSVTAGRLVDRRGYRVPLAGGAVGFMVGLLVAWAAPTLTGLVCSAILLGLSNVFFTVAMQSLVNRVGGDAARARNVSNFALAISIAQFAGPVLAGFAIDAVGHRHTYLLLAALPLGTLALLVWRRRHLPPAASRLSAGEALAPKPGSGGVRPGVLAMLSLPALRPVFATSAVAVAAFDLYSFFMPIYGHSIGLSATGIGLVLGTFAAAAFVVRAMMPRLVRAMGERRLLARSLWVAGAAYLVFPLITDPVLLAAVSAMLGFALGCGQPLTMMMCYDRAPPGRTGEALGVRFTIVNLTHLAIPVAFGAAGAVVGLAAVFWANGTLLAAGGVLGDALERRARVTPP